MMRTTEYRKGLPNITSRASLLRFIKQAKLTPLQRHMAMIVAQVSGFTAARNYVDGVRDREMANDE